MLYAYIYCGVSTSIWYIHGNTSPPPPVCIMMHKTSTCQERQRYFHSLCTSYMSTIGVLSAGDFLLRNYNVDITVTVLMHQRVNCNTKYCKIINSNYILEIPTSMCILRQPL